MAMAAPMAAIIAHTGTVIGPRATLAASAAGMTPPVSEAAKPLAAPVAIPHPIAIAGSIVSSVPPTSRTGPIAAATPTRRMIARRWSPLRS